MSEPLPRETCEAVAKVYASKWEGRRRAARLGDAFWVRRDGQVDRYAAKGWSVVVVFWCGEPAPIGGWPDVAVWAPRLDDLLELAAKVASGPVALMEDGQWRFGDTTEPDRCARWGATPSAAVAAWLLARKEGGA